MKAAREQDGGCGRGPDSHTASHVPSKPLCPLRALNRQPLIEGGGRDAGDPNPGTAAKKPLSFPCFLVDKAVDTSYGFVRVRAFVLSDAHCPSCTCSGLSYLNGVICVRYWKPLPEAERAQGRPRASAERAGGLGM